VEFLVDTSASFSVLNQQLTPLDKDFITIVGATGQLEKACFLKPLKYKLGKQIGIHRFLYMLGAPKSLLGRDLLEQLNATIIFRKGQIEFEIEDTKLTEILSLSLIQTIEKGEIPQDILDQVYPGVWAWESQAEPKMQTQ